MRCDLLLHHLHIMQMQISALISSAMIGHTAAADAADAADAAAAPVAAATNAEIDFASR